MIKPLMQLPLRTLEFLISVVGEARISVKPPDLAQHAHDQSFHPAHRPAAVIWPETPEEISAIVKFAARELIPVTPWGAGTSLEGNPIPLYGGIVLDTQHMNRILNIQPADFQADVQAGVLYKDLNGALSKHGLFFAPDPGANATIGGMVANNAAGTRTVRYGATKDNVLRLEVVLASGEVIRTGSRVSKTSSGYDLTHLFIGSEGTLGVITEATLKLAPLPDKLSALIASFPSAKSAAQTVSSIMGSGLNPAALEFLDVAAVSVLNAGGEFTLPEHPTLLMEFHSATQGALQEELRLAEEICTEERCISIEAGLGRDERNRLWRVRHQAYEILVRSNPDSAFLIVDVAVPVSEYPELVTTAQQAMSRRNLQGYLVGHAGDGNLHPLIAHSPNDTSNYDLAFAADREIVEAAIRMGGTATGEHGVGIGKRGFMVLEHGEGLEVMRTIKSAFDPQGILNPGKIFDLDDH
jgi:D-lactate dehydrogenase (cytochrome)